MRTIEVMNLKDEITKLIKQVVEEMVEDARKHRWVPVTERTPALYTGCIVTYNKVRAASKEFSVTGTVFPEIVMWDGENWVDLDRVPLDVVVVAWMPPPAPYWEVK